MIHTYRRQTIFKTKFTKYDGNESTSQATVNKKQFNPDVS